MGRWVTLRRKERVFGGVDGGETVVWMYCMNNKKKRKEDKSKERSGQVR